MGTIVTSEVTGRLEDSDFVLRVKNELRTRVMDNLAGAIASGKYSGPEIYAMQVLGMLGATSDVDLANLLIRGELMDEIEEKGLFNIHPEKFGSAAEAIARFGKLSATKQYNIQTLRKVIFPWVMDNLGISPQQLYQEISETNLFEILPILRAMIEGKSRSKKSMERAERLLEEHGSPEAAATALLGSAGESTLTELRKTMSGTTGMSFFVLESGDNRTIIGELDQDQYTELRRKLERAADFTMIDMANEDPARLPVLKRLVGATA